MKASRATAIVGAGLFVLAAWILTRELGSLGPARVAAALHQEARGTVLLALLLVAINYFVLTLHDQLAVAYVGRRLGWWRVTLASFVGFAVSNTLGFGVLSGATARYRFYARWSVDAGELSRIVAFYSATFWLGLMVVGGVSLAIAPLPALADFVSAPLLRGAGVGLVAAALGYVAACRLRRTPIRIGRIEVALPSTTLAVAQLAVSVVDWLLAAGILYTLVPEPRPSYLAVATAFTVAQFAGLASHIPGGVGVFEGLLLLMLRSSVDAASLVQALLLFRIVYYLAPLAIALVILIADEALQRRHIAAAWRDAFGTMAGILVPRALAAFTFLSGVVLLLSGATPGDPVRLAWLARVMPLPLVEVSHFAASLAGVLLLFLAQAIAARVDAGLYLAAGALIFGAVASLLKGGDYEEAMVLGLVLAALLSARRDFTRRARVFERPLSPGWTAAAATVVAASLWLGVFMYRNVAYSHDLWWQFAFDANAPRFLRASVAVTILALVTAVRSLLRPSLPRPLPAGEASSAAVESVVTQQPRTLAHLVYLGDKATLWNGDRTGFVMYGARGRSWVALGDPIAPPHEVRPLIARFLDAAHQHGATPVFYEVSCASLDAYADYGLSLVKVGEEARVRLSTFALAGGRHKHLRSTMARIARDGVTFRVVPPAEVPQILDQLREVSDEWLSSKQANEKGFSLGFFHPAYIGRFHVAVMENGGRIEAFANLLQGAQRHELSPDLMRYRESAPKAVMDALFGHMMLWGQAQGFEWFNLGIAPLSGLPDSPVGRAWSLVGRFVYRHGESRYNFRGVRAYKEKFGPVWEPRYLAYPGGLSLPRVLADVTTLIAGGYRQVFGGGVRRAA